MRSLVVLMVALCGVSLAKQVALPLTATTDAVYDLCSNSEVRCVAETAECIPTKNCENLVVIEGNENTGFVYHMMTTGHAYISIAFSNDKSMGNEMCVSCYVDADANVHGILSHNVGKKNVEEVSQDELKITVAQMEDETLYCKYTLDDTLTFARKSDNGTASRFYVLGVSGSLKADGKIGKHGSPFIPEEMWAFGPLAGTEDFYDMCQNGKNVKCVGAWSKSESEDGACFTYRNCTKAYAMEDSDDGLVFHMFGTDVAYMSIGFSQDQKMGSDAVIACVNNGTHVNGILSRNDGYKNIQSESKEGLSMIEAKVEDATIYCSFTLDDTVAFAQTLEDGNAETEFYVIGAGGELNDDGSLGHHMGHLMSEDKWVIASSGAMLLTSSILFAIVAVFLNVNL